MKNKFFCFFTFFYLCTLIYAKSVSDRPDWVDNWRTIYPDSTYIAQFAKVTGKKGDKEVKTVAANTIAQFIKTKVQSETTSTMKTATASDGKGRLVTGQEKSNTQNINLSVDVALTSLEFTEPWYNKKEKTWCCVAYLSREKVYQGYKPTVQDGCNKFLAIYEKAENEPEPLLKCNYYKTAFNSGDDFKTAYDFANLLNPDAVKKDFSETRNKLNAIPAAVKQIILQSTVSVNVNGDYGDSNYSAIQNCFSEMGFVIQKETPAYVLEAEMNDNDSVYKFKSRETHSLYPSISVVLKNRDGIPVYTFCYKTNEKTTNFSLETAQRDAYPRFAQEMKKALSQDFTEKLGINDLDLLFN